MSIYEEEEEGKVVQKGSKSIESSGIARNPKKIRVQSWDSRERLDRQMQMEGIRGRERAWLLSRDGSHF